MPPRTKGVTKRLDGFVIAVCCRPGKFKNKKYTRNSFKGIIDQFGGTFVEYVTKATTHIVVTDVSRYSKTVQSALAKREDLILMMPEWLIDIESGKKRLNANDYTWPQSQTKSEKPNTVVKPKPPAKPKPPTKPKTTKPKAAAQPTTAAKSKKTAAESKPPTKPKTTKPKAAAQPTTAAKSKKTAAESKPPAKPKPPAEPKAAATAAKSKKTAAESKPPATPKPPAKPKAAATAAKSKKTAAESKPPTKPKTTKPKAAAQPTTAAKSKKTAAESKPPAKPKAAAQRTTAVKSKKTAAESKPPATPKTAKPKTTKPKAAAQPTTAAKSKKTAAESKPPAKPKPPAEPIPPDPYHIWADPKSGVIYDAYLKKPSEFFRVQVVEDPESSKFWTRTHCGPIGELGSVRFLGNGDREKAVEMFERKFKSHSGLVWENRFVASKLGMYAYVPHYGGDSDTTDHP
ncbi:hypothetical protein Forpi1262_v014371 [Fusarium oxysporum f. sp. raphani]|uniref:NAD(+) ADP-ribosyltransferase n=1 Tax=Fusarium oxysporum f. sp. raphani TaxID=96318 RepID=A0A8J5PB04_FUSOX|nr:hypothetical protein Forpi1262_v014371 [Fusarium oxysporum f. sp. raphani]